jgi:hypothetical protein
MLRSEQITSRLSEIDVEIEALEMARKHCLTLFEDDALATEIHSLIKERKQLVKQFEERFLS